MASVKFGCEELYWDKLLPSLFHISKDVRLHNVNIEYDRELLEKLAKEAGLFFSYDDKEKIGYFQVKKLNL